MTFKVSIKNNKKIMDFGHFRVIEEKKKSFYGIYDISDIHNPKMLTHRASWRSATKTALLLYRAFNSGYEDGKESERCSIWR